MLRAARKLLEQTSARPLSTARRSAIGMGRDSVVRPEVSGTNIGRDPISACEDARILEGAPKNDKDLALCERSAGWDLTCIAGSASFSAFRLEVEILLCSLGASFALSTAFTQISFSDSDVGATSKQCLPQESENDGYL